MPSGWRTYEDVTSVPSRVTRTSARLIRSSTWPPLTNSGCGLDTDVMARPDKAAAGADTTDASRTAAQHELD